LRADAGAEMLCSVTVTAEQELAFAGPAALAALVRAGQVHPRELVELCLARIEALDGRTNAFRVTMAEPALAAADALAADLALTESELPLAGVPIAVKDDIAVAGQATTKGSRSYGPPAAADAEAIRRLRAAGAIPIGITNVPELTIFPWTATAANGVTRNPWDLTRTPGGCSGGSAAAVASGMVPVATGSDGGGSIRIPAACCGLVGMKSTRGRVSMAPAGEGWLGLSVYGALTRSVADSALMLDVMDGALAGDFPGAPQFAGSYVEAAARPPGRLRIAVSAKVPAGLVAWVAAGQRAAFDRTAALLSTLGHEVSECDPAYGLAQLEFLQTWLRSVYEESCAIPDPTRLESTTRQMAAGGRRLVPPRRRAALLRRRSRTSARIMALWNEFDVLLTPGLAKTAIAAEGGYGRPAPLAIDIAGRFTPFTPLFNLTGQPAVSLPAGVGSDGLPLSVQLVGRMGAEDMLYALAAQIEAAAPWSQLRPALH
jgi:amidase